MLHNPIDLGVYPKVKLGYAPLLKVISSIGECKESVVIVYDFTTHELTITEDLILKHLDLLGIQYVYILPLNSIDFIKSDVV